MSEIEMSEKEKYAQRVMGEKCANCGYWITPPQNIVLSHQTYPLCDCGNPHTSIQKLFANVPVAEYKSGGQ